MLRSLLCCLLAVIGLQAYVFNEESRVNKDLTQKLLIARPNQPRLQVSSKHDENTLFSYKYAVDVTSNVSIDTFNCLSQYGHSLAFVRIYKSDNGGQGDVNGVENAFSAKKAGLSYEAYITPSTINFHTGAKQFVDAYGYAKSQGLILNRIWIKVTDPISWNNNPNTNIEFLNDIITKAESLNIKIGIFTNWYDWYQITSAATSSTSYPLWYWATNGKGARAESNKDYYDFVAFGPFRSPIAKQYGIEENICFITANTNIYAQSNSFFAVPNTVNLSARQSNLVPKTLPVTKSQ